MRQLLLLSWFSLYRVEFNRHVGVYKPTSLLTVDCLQDSLCLKNTQRRRDFKGGVAFGVARNFCSGLALTLIICCYCARGKRPRHSKSRGTSEAGEMSERETSAVDRPRGEMPGSRYIWAYFLSFLSNLCSVWI